MCPRVMVFGLLGLTAFAAQQRFNPTSSIDVRSGALSSSFEQRGQKLNRGDMVNKLGEQPASASDISRAKTLSVIATIAAATGGRSHWVACWQRCRRQSESAVGTGRNRCGVRRGSESVFGVGRKFGVQRSRRTFSQFEGRSEVDCQPRLTQWASARRRGSGPMAGSLRSLAASCRA